MIASTPPTSASGHSARCARLSGRQNTATVTSMPRHANPRTAARNVAGTSTVSGIHDALPTSAAAAIAASLKKPFGDRDDVTRPQVDVLRPALSDPLDGNLVGGLDPVFAAGERRVVLGRERSEPTGHRDRLDHAHRRRVGV